MVRHLPTLALTTVFIFCTVQYSGMESALLKAYEGSSQRIKKVLDSMITV